MFTVFRYFVLLCTVGAAYSTSDSVDCHVTKFSAPLCDGSVFNFTWRLARLLLEMRKSFVLFVPTENSWLLCRSFPKEKQKRLILCSLTIEAAYSMRKNSSFSRRGLRTRETGYCRCYKSRCRNGTTSFVVGNATLSSCYTLLFRKFPLVPASFMVVVVSPIYFHISACDDTF